jgi:hypothetical protein
MEVLNPTGAMAMSHPHAGRLSKLEGKTIGLLSNGIWQAHRTLPRLKELLEKRFPNATFEVLTSGTNEIQQDSMMDLIVEKEFDAVIVGNAA